MKYHNTVLFLYKLIHFGLHKTKYPVKILLPGYKLINSNYIVDKLRNCFFFKKAF